MEGPGEASTTNGENALKNASDAAEAGYGNGAAPQHPSADSNQTDQEGGGTMQATEKSIPFMKEGKNGERAALDELHGEVQKSAEDSQKMDTSSIASESNDKKNVKVLENMPGSLKKRSIPFDEALDRKKRRRKLRRMLAKAGEFPSFVALISASPDEDNEDKMDGGEIEEEAPEVIYIDVDEYLGLKQSQPRASDLGLQSKKYPERILSSKASATSITATPAEEGYYEGRAPVALPEDSHYLSPLQQLVRNNLEFFSATATDVKSPQYGRRAPIVLGKVGVRCIHCAKVGLEAEAESSASTASINGQPVYPGSSVPSSAAAKAPDGRTAPKRIDPSKIWPTGSVSYPMNISGLHSLCSQKPQLHFEHCPNLPASVKAQFQLHLHETSKRPEGRSRSREVPTSMYYILSAKRLGLVNVGDGIRFARDLRLDPLPLEAVLAQENQEAEATVGSSYVAPTPQVVGSTSSGKPADPTAQQVLAEAIAEPDNPKKLLARAADKNLVSDFIFLCIRQMGICHAVPADFSTRGKKTKKMRIGFAGFCCRHCQKAREEQDGDELARAYSASEYSCRSFSSEADNLASAISNAFALHLQKCPHVPRRIKSALTTYKRMHQRQMAQLEYGSQRRLFTQLWTRLRASDVPEDEMLEKIKKYKPLGSQPVLSSSRSSAAVSQSPAKPSVPKSSSVKTASNGTAPDRGSDFPKSTNPETLQILKMSEENWDVSTNGGLIQLSDRDLVSDYVFLTMRQLKVALPNSVDLAKARRTSVMAGLCCIHCDDKDQSMISPSGRTFPSQPDNYASALNSSMYNHMQNCHYISDSMKRSLADLRKIHSGQCQRLAFGAQRRYFNILFNRLKKVPLPDRPEQVERPLSSPSSAPKGTPRANQRSKTQNKNRVTRGTENSDDSVLGQFGFFEAPCQSFFCVRCRMVPLPLRARGSLSFARPAIDFMSDHYKACKENGFDLWFAVESLKKLLHVSSVFKVDHLADPLFKDVVIAAFGGNEDLATIFTTEISKVYQMSRHGGVTNAVENYIRAKSEGLWCKFPTSVDSTKVVRSFAKFAESVDGMSPKLHDHKDVVTYLLLISPSLKLPDEDDDEDVDVQEIGGESSDSSSDVDEEENWIQRPVDRKPRGKELRRRVVHKYDSNDHLDDIDDEAHSHSQEEVKVEQSQPPSTNHVSSVAEAADQEASYAVDAVVDNGVTRAGTDHDIDGMVKEGLNQEQFSRE